MTDPVLAVQIASQEDLLRLWQKNIDRHPGDSRWPRWRDGALAGNADGSMVTFAVIAGGEPVGEGTLMLSSACPQIGGRKDLADGARVANVDGLRIEKPYEGRGYISRLVHEMEAEAARRGYSRLTIGVDAGQTRNLAIYLHWGYDRLVRHEIEDGELVLYYEKKLTGNTEKE